MALVGVGDDAVELGETLAIDFVLVARLAKLCPELLLLDGYDALDYRVVELHDVG